MALSFDGTPDVEREIGDGFETGTNQKNAFNGLKARGSRVNINIPFPTNWRGERGAQVDDQFIRLGAVGPENGVPVLVLGGISAGRHVSAAVSDGDSQGWWSDIVHAGGAVDIDRHLVFSLDFFPENPAGFIDLTTNDYADVIAYALKEAGVNRLHAAIGASFGGMVCLKLAERHPGLVDRLAVLCAAHRSSPMAQGWRRVQRRILSLGLATGCPEEATAIARELAITTYRTPEEFSARFSESEDVCAYLAHHGETYAANVSAARYLTLSASIDSHDLTPENITAPTLLIGATSDRLVPIDDIRTLSTRLGGPVQFNPIPSKYGHDAFLKETATIGPLLRSFLEDAFISKDQQPMTISSVSDTAPANGPIKHQETIAANAGVGRDAAHRAVAPPIHLSATYAWDDPTEKPGFDYSRSGNPTRRQLEEALAALEGAAGGVLTATGMAAVDLVLTLVKPGELVLAPHDCYGGTHRLLTARARLGHFDLAFVNQTDPAALDAAFARRPKLVLIETPSNPLLRVTDVADVARRAKEVGAISVADNTFLSPALQQPLALGCDVVVHSTTKYINGHSDVVGGAVLAKDKALADELYWWANCTGVTGAAFDSYLTLRGLRTLFTRLERQQATAERLVAFLANDERVVRVNYPGLKSHPGHEIAARQQKGFGAMFSVEFAENIDVLEVLRGFDLFTTAESLGGFESLVCVPAAMTHAAMPPEARAAAGISDRLVRFSIGLEHAEDLLADLETGLARGEGVGDNGHEIAGHSSDAAAAEFAGHKRGAFLDAKEKVCA